MPRNDVSAAAVLIRASGAILLVGLVSDATRAHERDTCKPHVVDLMRKRLSWRRVVRNRIDWAHDARHAFDDDVTARQVWAVY